MGAGDECRKGMRAGCGAREGYGVGEGCGGRVRSGGRVWGQKNERECRNTGAVGDLWETTSPCSGL